MTAELHVRCLELALQTVGSWTGANPAERQAVILNVAAAYLSAAQPAPSVTSRKRAVVDDGPTAANGWRCYP